MMSKLKVENSMHQLFIPIQYSFMQWSWHGSIFLRALLGWLKNVCLLNFTKILLRVFPTTETFLSPDKSKLRCDRCVRRWLRGCVRGWGVNCGKIGLRRLLTACSSHNSSHYFSFSIFFAFSCSKTSFCDILSSPFFLCNFPLSSSHFSDIFSLEVTTV